MNADPKPTPAYLRGPVTAWAFLQLALLGIGASGFPLWAHHLLPRESLALPILLCGQILVFSMLFPVLGTTWLGLTINLLLMLPFDELAGLLSSKPQLLILEGGACVGIWMVGLSFWQKHPIATTFATLFVAGGCVLDYLRWEAMLTDGQQINFHPLSLLPNICLPEGGLNWWEALIPAFLAILNLTVIKLQGGRNVPPLDSTINEMTPKSAS